MEIRPETVFAVSPDVLFQEVHGELVLLDMAGDAYFGLDATGARVWGLLGEGASVGVMVETLLGEYDVDRATLESDLEVLLKDLLSAGLISA